MVSLPHISIKRSSVQQQQQHQHQHQQQQNANERKEKKISSRSYLGGMAVAGHAAGFRRNSLPSDWSNFFLSGFVGKGQPDWPPGGAINSIFDFIFVSFFCFCFFTARRVAMIPWKKKMTEKAIGGTKRKSVSNQNPNTKTRVPIGPYSTRSKFLFLFQDFPISLIQSD